MNIIYHCRGGTHSSPTAAALHLGILPMDKIPDSYTFLKIVPEFDVADNSLLGHLRFVGRDEFGHNIYCMGRRKAGDIVVNAVKDVIRMDGGDPANFLFINVMPPVNFWMKLGGFSSRALNLIGLGRPLVAYGTQKAFPELVEIVTRTKSALKLGRIPAPTKEQDTVM